MRNDSELSVTARRLADFARESNRDKLVRAKIDTDNNKVIVYWYGSVPADVTAFGATLESDIEFVSVLYSHDELEREARRLSLIPYVSSVGFNRPFDGLIVSVDVTQTALSSVKITSSVPYELVPVTGHFELARS